MSGPTSEREKSHKRKAYYDRDVDFDELAKQDPDFAAIFQASKKKGFIDFQDPNIVQQLTKSVLKCDFDLSLALPPDRLCPPVPVRWNYIRWIQDLLDTTSDDISEHYDPEREVVGLDIGVGASCIYAMLACSTRSNWRMAGTDIDAHSLDFAKQNVKANNLDGRIKLALTKPSDPLLPLDAMKVSTLDFVMTNPPFYSSAADMQASYTHKTSAPSAVCTGAANEMIFPGGDLGFVSRVLAESLRLRERVQWYTAMFGMLHSVQNFVAKLKEHEITNYAVTVLQAGHRTKRWAVAWSFGDYRPRNDISRHGELIRAVLPSPTAQTVAVPKKDVQWTGKNVQEVMGELDVRWRWKPLLAAGVMVAKENVWSRAARRKKKLDAARQADGAQKDDEMASTEEEDSDEEGPIALAVKITCKDEEVEVQWLRGHDRLFFESFCGMLKTTLLGRL